MAYQNIYVDRYGEPATVYIWDDKVGLQALPLSEFLYAFVKDKNGSYVSMDNHRVKKTRRYKKNSTDVYEVDVPMETRVLTDLYLNDDAPSEGHVILFFDIEVSMENGIPDTDLAESEITSIALYDSLIKKYQVLTLDRNQLYEDKETEDTEIIFCDNEINLLLKFMNIYQEIQPTIITGWNSNYFDIPYLYNRLRKVCGPEVASGLSPIGKVKYSQRLEKYEIAGVSLLDYLEMYKKFTYTQLPNYRLDTVGRLEVGMGKIEYEGSLDDLFENNLEEFIDYNKRDVEIIVELDNKLNFIDLVREICHIGHVPYDNYSMSSRFLEGTIITHLHRRGIVVTNKPKDGREKLETLRKEEGFTGAFVKEPKPGLYEWVYSLDLQSLYPSIIMSLNISPETKAGFVRNWDIEKHIKKEIDEYQIKDLGLNIDIIFSYIEFMDYLKDNELVISSNGVLYETVRKGIIPEVLETWFEQRKYFQKLAKQFLDEGDEEKANFYSRRQHIQKIFLNSLYGVLGLPVFRFYDVDNASAVTLTGQDVIKTSAKYVNNKYINHTGKDEDFCIYIDTDSLYFQSLPLVPGNNLLEETINVARTMEEELNSFYDVMSLRMFNCRSHKLHIKGETISKIGFWVTKKRYALNKIYDLETNTDVDSLTIKGLDVVRSSFPQAFREFMSQLLSDILNKVSKETVDQKVLNFKNSLNSRPFMEIARNTSANNISRYSDGLDELNFQKGTPAHIKAAITYNRLLRKFKLDKKYESIQDGFKIKYVYLKENPLKIPSVAVKGYNDPPEILKLINDYVDTDALFNKELKRKLSDFYHALGWGNIPTEINQNANEWFSF